jgi:hypothetical protein
MLAQGCVLRNAAKLNSAHKEGVRGIVVYGFNLILTQTQLAKLALEDVAAGNARA